LPATVPAGSFEGKYAPLFDEDGKVVGGTAVIREITERKRAEGAALEAHQRLLFHVENSPLAIIEWDTDFRVSRWSASAERLFGWTAEEVIGKHVSEWHFVLMKMRMQLLKLLTGNVLAQSAWAFSTTATTRAKEPSSTASGTTQYCTTTMANWFPFCRLCLT
jgi:PAS domain-containing protein